MFDSAELRVHPTGKAILKLGVKSQGQGHETTFAQIVAEELGIPYEDIEVQEGDTDNTPYGLGTYASALDAGRRRGDRRDLARKLRDKARTIAAHLLEASEDDLEWERDRFSVKGAPDRAKTIQEIAFAAYTDLPDGVEAGLEGVHYYDPPNMTFPFGTYAVVVEVDRGTGAVEGSTRRRGGRLRRADQPDDRRGPDHGRPHRGLRHRGHGADHVRRGRQLHRLELHATTCCRPPGRRRRSSSARRSRRRRTTRSARRESASRPRSDRPPRTSTRWSTRSPTRASGTSRCRVTSAKVWEALQEAGLAE